MQLGVIEFARNVCGMEKSHHDETDEEGECPDPKAHAVCILPEQEKIRQQHGFFGTQRLGDYACVLDKSFVRELYEKVGRPDEHERNKIQRYDKLRLGSVERNDFVVFERHRHRREVNPDYLEILKKNGMLFPGIHRTLDGTTLVEIISLKGHPYFVASQFHPEFTSTYLRPNPLFLGFAEAVKNF